MKVSPETGGNINLHQVNDISARFWTNLHQVNDISGRFWTNYHQVNDISARV
jgi:hypothetical protein